LIEALFHASLLFMAEENKDKKTEESSLGDELQVYELGFHLLSTISEENLSKEVGNLKAIIEKESAFFIGEEGLPKTIKLAYEIDKVIDNKRISFDSAYFGWVKFEVNPKSIKAINKGLEKLESILRFLLIKSVRESRMVLRKPVSVVGQSEKPNISKSKSEKDAGPISEVEVDKAIEELVVE
jgi:ribosomal protein S6